jgi:anti-sigma regulatory factor (Ser/Thr protein kinase)
MSGTRPSAKKRDRTIILPNSLTAPREAREACREILAEWGLEGQIDLVMLLVSELVTNSVRYTAGGIAVRISADSGRLRMEIHDDEPRLPVPRQADSNQDSGRGLLLVEELSSNWGAERVQDGKIVWFELAGSAQHAHA